jgi:hypothetical protein
VLAGGLGDLNIVGLEAAEYVAPEAFRSVARTSAAKSENSVPACVTRRHFRRSSQSRFVYQSSLLGDASTSLTDSCRAG